MERPPHNPHDKLFKQTFGDPAATAGFLSAMLAEPLSRAIRWDLLKLEPASFIDSQFRSSESDLLFSTRLADKPARIYLLFEHQRSPDNAIALRLLRYMVRIWEHYQKSYSRTPPLPAILPVVLAHNAEHWDLPETFSSLFDLPKELHNELESFLPDFSFRLIQLADFSFEKIPGIPPGVLTLRLFKAELLGRLLDDLIWHDSLPRQSSDEIVERALRYIAAAADLDKVAFLEKLKTVTDDRVRQAAMTLEQQFRQEGRLEGRLEGHQEGLLKGKRLLLERLLTRKFGPLPELISRKLENASPSEMEKWAEAVLDAHDLDDVFQE